MFETAEQRAQWTPSGSAGLVIEARVVHWLGATKFLNHVMLHHGVISISALQLNTRTLNKFFAQWSQDTGHQAGNPASWYKLRNDQTAYASAAADYLRQQRSAPWVESVGKLLDGLILHEVCGHFFPGEYMILLALSK